MSAPKSRFNIFTITALALVSLAIWQAYSPLLHDKDAIVALTASTVELSGSEAVEKIREKTGKPTLVYLYASWCDACRVMTPTLASLIRNRRIEDFRLVFIAYEQSGYRLATHLNRKQYDGLWTPYFIKGGPAPELQQLTDMDIRGIPLFLAFDAKGKLRTSKQGVLHAEALDAIISELRPSATRRNP